MAIRRDDGDEFVRVVNDQYNTSLALPYEIIQFSTYHECLGRLSIGLLLETSRIGIPDGTDTEDDVLSS